MCVLSIKVPIQKSLETYRMLLVPYIIFTMLRPIALYLYDSYNIVFSQRILSDDNLGQGI